MIINKGYLLRASVLIHKTCTYFSFASRALCTGNSKGGDFSSGSMVLCAARLQWNKFLGLLLGIVEDNIVASGV